VSCVVWVATTQRQRSWHNDRWRKIKPNVASLTCHETNHTYITPVVIRVSPVVTASIIVPHGNAIVSCGDTSLTCCSYRWNAGMGHVLFCCSTNTVDFHPCISCTFCYCCWLSATATYAAALSSFFWLAWFPNLCIYTTFLYSRVLS